MTRVVRVKQLNWTVSKEYETLADGVALQSNTVGPALDRNLGRQEGLVLEMLEDVL
jgi:hypothetical protein